jgi:hypothetical protein
MAGIKYTDYVETFRDRNEVANTEYLRNLYDTNVANKDKIYQELAATPVGAGDKVHVDNLTEKINRNLSSIAITGDYEHSGVALSESMNAMMTDKGYLLSKASYKARSEEVGYIKEQLQKGENVLDFGNNAWKSHQSYYKDENGDMIENQYSSQVETQLEYGKKMSDLLKTIKADDWGITQGKADGIASRLVSTYLASKEGKQDYRRLTQIGVDPELSKEDVHKNAIQDIFGRMKSFTSQYVHQKNVSGAKSRSGMLSGMNAPINWKGSTSTPIGLVTGGASNNIMELRGRAAKASKSGDFKSAANYNKMADQLLHTAYASGAISKEDYLDYYNNEIGIWTDNGDNDEAVGGLVSYWTNNTWQSDFSTQDDFDWGTTAAVSATTGAVAGTAALIGGANAWNPIGWGIGLGFLAYGAYELGSMLFEDETNVRDLGRNGSADNIADYRNEGDQSYFFDNEVEQLMQNIENIDRVNELLGTTYTEKDVPRLKDKALIMLDHKYNGGDDIDQILEEWDDDVINSHIYVPDSSKDGAAILNRIQGSVEAMNLKDFEVLGIPQTSEAYEELMGKDKDGNINHNTKLDFKGLIASDLLTDTPIRMMIGVGNNIVMVEPKGANNSSSFEYLEGIAETMGRGDLIIMNRARQILYGENGNGRNSTYNELAYAIEYGAMSSGASETEANALTFQIFSQYLQTDPDHRKAFQINAQALESGQIDQATYMRNIQTYTVNQMRSTEKIF